MSIVFKDPATLQAFRDKFQRHKQPAHHVFSESDTFLMTNNNGDRRTKEVIEKNDDGRYSRMEINDGRIEFSNGFGRRRQPRKIERTLTPFYEPTRKRKRKRNQRKSRKHTKGRR